MLAGSAYWQVDRAKRKEFDGLMDEKKAREKQAAWIKELEARDEEDKEMREAMRRRKERGGKGIVGELKDADTRAQVQKAVDEAKAVAEKVAKVVADKTGKEGNQVEGIASVAPEDGKERGILQSVQDLIWKKK